MRLRTCVFVVILVLLASPSILGQCALSQGYAPGSAMTIGVHAGTGWTEAPPIGSAVSMWNNGCSGTAGVGFPMLLSGQYGDIDITVTRIHSQAPPSPGACAYFDEDFGPNNEIIGGDIRIYTRDASGQDCTWMLPHVTLDNLIAHELGHVLGLANSACSGIMGGNWPHDAPTAEECAKADAGWTTGVVGDKPPGDGTVECPTSPILLDLDGNGFHLSGAADPVAFDINGDGLRERISWTASDARDAFLVLDRNRNSVVDNGSELFGTATPLQAGVPAWNGYVALQEFDTVPNGGNEDGALTANDLIWQYLLVWTDLNHNGVSEAEELTDVTAAGVLALELSFVESEHRDRFGNRFRYKSRAILRGHADHPHATQTYDVFFVSGQ